MTTFANGRTASSPWRERATGSPRLRAAAPTASRDAPAAEIRRRQHPPSHARLSEQPQTLQVICTGIAIWPPRSQLGLSAAAAARISTVSSGVIGRAKLS